MDSTASRIVCWQGHELQVLKAPGVWDEAATAAMAASHCSSEPAPPAGTVPVPPTTPDGNVTMVTVSLGVEANVGGVVGGLPVGGQQ